MAVRLYWYSVVCLATLLVVSFAFAPPASAQFINSRRGPEQTPIPRGASVFVEEMDNDLDGFIRAELLKQRVPVSVVLVREDAHIVIAGASSATSRTAWHEGWLTGTKDHAEGNIMVFDRASRSLLFAAEAGDRSLFWGNLARGGQRKVAARLVDRIKDAVAASDRPLPAPAPLAPEEKDTNTSSVPAGSADRMTNEDVVALVRGGLSDEVVIAKIKASERAFETTPEALLALKKAGVSEGVILAMLR